MSDVTPAPISLDEWLAAIKVMEEQKGEKADGTFTTRELVRARGWPETEYQINKMREVLRRLKEQGRIETNYALRPSLGGTTHVLVYRILPKKEKPNG